MTTNQSLVEPDEEENGLKGLEGVEPEIGLMSWAEELVGLVGYMKDRPENNTLMGT